MRHLLGKRDYYKNVQNSGISPVSNERLNMILSGIDITLEISLRKSIGKPSGVLEYDMNHLFIIVDITQESICILGNCTSTGGYETGDITSLSFVFTSKDQTSQSK